MQIKNDYDKEFFNGDIGRIAKIDTEEQELIVDFLSEIIYLRTPNIRSFLRPFFPYLLDSPSRIVPSPTFSSSQDFVIPLLPIFYNRFLKMSTHQMQKKS